MIRPCYNQHTGSCLTSFNTHGPRIRKIHDARATPCVSLVDGRAGSDGSVVARLYLVVAKWPLSEVDRHLPRIGRWRRNFCHRRDPVPNPRLAIPERRQDRRSFGRCVVARQDLAARFAFGRSLLSTVGLPQAESKPIPRFPVPAQIVKLVGLSGLHASTFRA